MATLYHSDADAYLVFIKGRWEILPLICDCFFAHHSYTLTTTPLMPMGLSYLFGSVYFKSATGAAALDSSALWSIEALKPDSGGAFLNIAKVCNEQCHSRSARTCNSLAHRILLFQCSQSWTRSNPHLLVPPLHPFGALSSSRAPLLEHPSRGIM